MKTNVAMYVAKQWQKWGKKVRDRVKTERNKKRKEKKQKENLTENRARWNEAK